MYLCRYKYIYIYIDIDIPPKNEEIALWPSTKWSISYILVLAGSESSFTVITEYNFISLL